MKEVYSWKRIEYKFQNDTHRQQMIDTGQFTPGNSVPTSIALWSNKMFLTTPRFKLGVPATLSYIHTNDTGKFRPDSITTYLTRFKIMKYVIPTQMTKSLRRFSSRIQVGKATISNNATLPPYSTCTLILAIVCGLLILVRSSTNVKPTQRS